MVLKSLLKYVKKLSIIKSQPNKSKQNHFKYTKQRNKWDSKLRKSKKEYYSSLHGKDITDNRTFWKTVKPFLADKVTSTQKVTLVDNDNIVKNNDGTTRVLKTFFSNFVNDLQLDYINYDPLAHHSGARLRS